jgi:hypothetical protein
MFPFDPTIYGPLVAPLLADDRLPELGPGRPHIAMKPTLQILTLEKLFPSGIVDSDMARACLAGLWLWHDFLDESHAISQDIDTPTGSWWHGILHRREPDAANAKYWFRRIGPHPIVERLASEAPALGYAYQNPLVFVDFCEAARGIGSADEDLAQRVQRLEWRLLFDFCWNLASKR